MDFIEKAKIRLEHWKSHNDHHHEEYQIFADHLEDAGKTRSAAYVREMSDLTAKISDCLDNALKDLDE
ncbi:MAG: hypothetical protein ABIE47_02830 [Pseudomonadota bacterium]|nr:hypothetical protein [Desulfobacterales bacterium]MBL6967501.1 hypothetical protein [Desulfobacteraceae bacterium]MBL7173561.1 hypothetical protein [Desulfobacteraceae bacterium]